MTSLFYRAIVDEVKNPLPIIIILVVIFAILVLVVVRSNQPSTYVQPSPSASVAVSSPPTALATFKGTLPCADCPGIDTVITLKPDGTYESSMTYQGKSTAPFTETGKYVEKKGIPTDANAMYYQLINSSGEVENYLISGDTITQLDKDLGKIDAPFNLSLKKQ